MAGCDAVIACEYTIKYDETKQMLDTNSHEGIFHFQKTENQIKIIKLVLIGISYYFSAICVAT